MGGLFGLAFFAAVYGLKILDPGNIGWLMVGDAATHFIGWHFFRSEDWLFPLGMLHRYGMEIASSVVYSDSIPLFALLFKPFSTLLPKIFQYTGIWIALCYFLQGFFAWQLLRRVSDDLAVQVLGTVFFVISPILLFRGSLQHYALMGHWLILAGFVLYLSPSVKRPEWHWGSLVLVAVLVHAYLAVMVLTLCAADGFKRYALDRSLPAAGILRFALTVSLLLLLGMWQGGYFSAAGIAGGNSAYYSMNLSAPFMPTPGIVEMHPIPREVAVSTFLPLHPYFVWGQYEGFNYFGLGIILLLLPGPYQLWCGYGQRALRPLLPLAVACLLLALYAISPRVTLWDKILFEVPLPHFMQELTQVFRSTGRLFWPAYYGIILAAICLVVHRYGRRAATILAVALALQVIDLVPLLSPGIVARGAGQTYVSPLRSPFWAEAATHYRRVMVVPPAFTVEDFIPLSFYAASHSMEINMAYYGRPPSAMAERNRRERIAAFLAEGAIDRNTLYVFKNARLMDLVEPFLGHDTAIGTVDGELVMAPGWFGFEHLPTTRDMFKPRLVERNYAPLGPEQTISFNTPDSRHFVITGLSQNEALGTWTDGHVAAIGLRLATPIQTDWHGSFEVHPFVSDKHPMMDVTVVANGQPVTVWHLENGHDANIREVVIPRALAEKWGGNLCLAFHIRSPISPAELGMSGDTRQLGLKFASARFHPL